MADIDIERKRRGGPWLWLLPLLALLLLLALVLRGCRDDDPAGGGGTDSIPTMRAAPGDSTATPAADPAAPR